MKKKSQLLICLGVLFLATSCSNSVKPYNVSDDMVQNSIDLLSQRSDEATDYIYRYNDLLNQYTSYVDPSREITLLPDFTNNISIQPSIDIQGKDKSEIAVLHKLLHWNCQFYMKMMLNFMKTELKILMLIQINTVIKWHQNQKDMEHGIR